MNIDKTKNLLSQVETLLKNYEKLAQSTGENFNIFSVMGMETNEVKTHSAIIGELLNPKGSHNLKDIPLKLFLNLINKDLENPIIEIDTTTCECQVEEHIGFINEDKTEGGRLDIVIKDCNQNVFVIENKIYAGEQKNQLLRYKNQYGEAKIIFLTLFGNDAESGNDLIKDEDYFLVSYEKDILNWLEECLKESVKFPMLREVLRQYIFLIKKLTNQTMNKELEENVTALIKNNFLEASEIAKNFEKVKEEIIVSFLEELKLKIGSNLNENWQISDEILHKRAEPYYAIKRKDWKDVYIYFRKKGKSIFYGITLKEASSIDEIVINLKNTSELKNFKSSPLSVIWDDKKFPVKINTTEDVQKIINQKDANLEKTFKFVLSFKEDCTELCSQISLAINKENLKS